MTLRAARRRRVAVDARLLGRSGIGTYVEQVVPRVVQRMPDVDFVVLRGTQNATLPSAGGQGHARELVVRAGVYSVGEQAVLPLAVRPLPDVWWSTHYNVPVLHRSKLVVTVHDVCHLALPEIFPQWRYQAYARVMLSTVRRRAAAMMFPSAFSRTEFERLVGGLEDRGHVTPLGVADEWRQDAGRSPVPRPYFVFVGNAKPHKNIEAVVTAFSSVAHDIPHDLLVIGELDGFRVGDAAVEGYGRRVPGRISLLGRVTVDELRRYVANAAGLVFPSFYEGFGLPPLEAMAAGTPVIASDRGAIKEACGDAALLCDPARPETIAACMRALCSDPDLAASMKRRGRERSSLFSWDDCADKTAAILEQALGS